MFSFPLRPILPHFFNFFTGKVDFIGLKLFFLCTRDQYLSLVPLTIFGIFFKESSKMENFSFHQKVFMGSKKLVIDHFKVFLCNLLTQGPTYLPFVTLCKVEYLGIF